MKFTRLFTQPTPAIADQIKWKTLPSEILDKDGNRLFYMPEVQVPDHWSQGATNILAQKYFRKAGVPNETCHWTVDSGLKNVLPYCPYWLNVSKPISGATFGSETSAKQVFHRLAGAWTYWGWKEGIFNLRLQENMEPYTNGETCELNAQIFYDEIYYMLAMQIAAPNSPQWFNTGLNWAYGITGNPSGQWAVDEKGQPYETPDSYTHPQPHACFIQPITDSLVSSGGIMDLWTKEARLFKQGSGTGTNFSSIRGKGEPLSGGGKSSGLMSFLKIGDVVAGSIASGGTTRRAAKMVCLDLNHPEIEEFIDWKMNEEVKAAALYIGSQILNDEFHGKNGFLGGKEYIPTAMIDRFYNDIEPEICDLGFEGKAISTVDGQNANDSIRITDEFLQKVDGNHNWPLTARTTGKIVKVLKSEELWQKICRAAWACADPGLQFDDTINLWHTCKNDGRINASNPCSEYMFLDDTACNLASENLGKFLLPDGSFDTKSFIHATRLWTVVLEISVFMASFPSKEIARNSYVYRTLGLGYANAGGILMRLGLSYDSDKGRSIIAAITALMHGQSYFTSQEMNNELGPFERWEVNENCMANVISMHRQHVSRINCTGLAGKLVVEATKIWDQIDNNKGFRNAQTTLIAPTGTIALLMDCDTTGIEPDFSLVKYKHLSGGGMMKIVNECVPEALKTLGYTPAQIMSITQHITDHDTIEGWTVNGQSMSEEHLKVFDCAVPGGNGIRSLPPIAHVKMVAAVQPFLSGAVSKTVNMPNSATIADVDHIYREAHRLGLKAIAIYRDGSKLTQPLNTGNKRLISKEESPTEKDIKWANEIIKERESRLTPERSEGRVPDSISIENLYDIKNAEEALKEEDLTSLKDLKDETLNLNRGKRLRLPPRTTGYRQKYSVDGQSIYLHTGEYEDGRLGEIFVEFSREGSLVRALSNSIGKVVSIGLQYGVPLNEFVDAFVFTKFEPSGIVHGHDRIKLCTSPLDLIFKDLAIHYLDMEEFANTTPNMTQQQLDDTVNFIMNESLDDKTIDKNSLIPERSEGHKFVNTNPNDPSGNVEALNQREFISERSEGRAPAPTPDSTITPGSIIFRGAEEKEIHVTKMEFEIGTKLPDSGKFEMEIKQPVLDPSPTHYVTKEEDRILKRALLASSKIIGEGKPLTTIRLKHGDNCQLCGHYPTLRTGTCITCPNCGANSGCG